MAYAIPSPLACIGQLDAQEMSQSDMVSGPGPRFADQRVKSLSEAKTITTQHILKPGDPRSWQTFKGEFRSAIDAEALPALNRAKPYTLAECYEMLPADNRTDKAAADLLSRLNWLYDSASDYIYRCLYKNIDFTVPSHGPTLQSLIETEYETERAGPELYWHLYNMHDKNATESGQAEIMTRVTDAQIQVRMGKAIDSISAGTAIYSIHDDWGRIHENATKLPRDFIKIICRAMRKLPHEEIRILGFTHMQELSKTTAAPQATPPLYQKLKTWVDCITEDWPKLQVMQGAGASLMPIHEARPGGAGLALTQDTGNGRRYSAKTNACDWCPLHTCTSH